MRHDKLERELRLLLMLIENHHYTVSDICDRQQISRRNFYYYLEFFRDAGFIVEHVKPYYRIAKESPFFRKLDAAVHFTEDEAITMRQILEKTGDQGPTVQRLMQKLDKLYDLQIVNNVELREQLSRNVNTLYEAIKQKRVVVLRRYSSPHSNSERDRVVEPFLFMNGNREIRCYELDSAMNKTFKLSRMDDVEMLELLWSNEQKHRSMFTDVFMFSGEKTMTVVLRLGRLSMQVLGEEYPKAERFIEPDGEGHWRVEMPVCSYIGIGRFVLGLFEDIEVLGDDAFKLFINNKIERLNTKRL